MYKSHLGPDIAQSNRNIRKLLRLAQASPQDVFYDLGCGRGQLCVVAVSEFRLKRAVGIERRKDRAERARRLVRSLGLSRRIEVRNEDYRDSDIADATIAYNGLVEDYGDLEFYEDKLGDGCKLVTLSLPLVGVISDAVDYPFYLAKKPFRKTRKLSRWVHSALSRKATLEEFLEEIRIDPDYWTDTSALKGLMKERFTQ